MPERSSRARRRVPDVRHLAFVLIHVALYFSIQTSEPVKKPDR
jgi:hypothetical protein